MGFPKIFLADIAKDQKLTEGEKKVFIALFGDDKSRVQIAETIHSTESAVSSRLTGIYSKFQISDSGPVKENILKNDLINKYQAWESKNSKDSSILDSQQQTIDKLVGEVRQKLQPYIQNKCGTMRVLDMTQPIQLTGERGIYTKVNILEKITARSRVDIPELMQNCNPEDCERFGLNQVTEQRVPGLEAVKRCSKLMVLGKPGSGKTTFLKYLAMQCIEGQFHANRVPLFITLKDFAETPRATDLKTYISQSFTSCGISEGLFRQGRTLILLDGLDEVREEDTHRVLKEIRDFSYQFSNNHIVITCRIAAKEYTFEKFTEVEVADFNQDQITIFAQNWFRLTDPVKAEHFIQKLEKDKPIQELATNPLLLTLLCLVFGEAGNFPANRSELYKEGLDVLLKKWDAKRNIERDQVYKNLSVQRKEDLLSQIALTTFKQKDYFFKQKNLEEYIADFIRNLYQEEPNQKDLKLDSEAILKSIEAQHGLLVERAKRIYSFSHLTFHEYFAAREIVANHAYDSLVEYITDKSWREVFLLTAAMLRNADNLLILMKRKIDRLLIRDEKLQKFITWASQKALSIQADYKLAAIRAFYVGLGFSIDCEIDFFVNLCSIDLNLGQRLDKALKFLPIVSKIGIDNNLDIDLDLAFSLENDLIKYYLIIKDDHEHLYQPFNFSFAIQNLPKNELSNFLKKLRKQRPHFNRSDLYFNRREYPLEQFNKTDSKTWMKELRNMMIKHRNIGHYWQFSEQQKELLKQYYDANVLLVECLNSDCYVSREVRQEIEDTLLLPISEIEKSPHSS
ncbi:NACHT domain-containing protein [Moorena sp. SIO3H5]|uniref:NACHT domain-containing protein n=1 Tax=Moorena sp. SIO3H5 TaxID=2607834 RepID=UPI0013BC3DD1|nr:NACHT domain-containing protein [Moorena sp. SIO3H5]NEO68518.1 NACHT domain-containing protein [Moorena sp. SIO3H5]